jgi:hypothetical protein
MYTRPHEVRSTRAARTLLLTAVLCGAAAFAAPAAAWFDDYQPTVVVAGPYLDLHTGPGRGYPVFHSALAGEELVILRRRTQWIEVRAARDVEGWVHESALRETRDASGRPPEVATYGLDRYAARRFEFGISTGDFDGAASLSARAGWSLTPNIQLELEGTQVLGDYSDALMGSGNIVMIPFPEWRVSPFFKIGTGIIKIEPQTTLVQSDDRTDEIVNAGAGANVYLGDRFVLRAEYQRHTVLTSRDDNEEVDQWKAGFSVFF